MPDTIDVRRLLAAIERFAPLAGAADWDNVGLLAGDEGWPARRIMLAIDLTDAVAAEALRKRPDVLLVYHPPIFKGIRSISSRAESPTARLAELLGSRISIVALHTALDAAAGGTNDVLLDAFDVAQRFPLEPATSESQYKLVVFAPEADLARLRSALAAAGAGEIGRYRECSFELRGRGTFIGGESTNPAVGRRGRLEHVDEVRLEMILPRPRLASVIRALYANHSYEEPAFDVYPMVGVSARAAAGMGRVGVLRKPSSGGALLAKLGAVAELSGAGAVGSLNRKFSSVIAAAGSFGVRSFRDRDALVITGEFKHHDALELLRRGVTAIHLGHYASERPVLRRVRERLLEEIRGLRVDIARADASPFRPIRSTARSRT